MSNKVKLDADATRQFATALAREMHRHYGPRGGERTVAVSGFFIDTVMELAIDFFPMTPDLPNDGTRPHRCPQSRYARAGMALWRGWVNDPAPDVPDNEFKQGRKARAIYDQLCALGDAPAQEPGPL